MNHQTLYDEIYLFLLNQEQVCRDNVGVCKYKYGNLRDGLIPDHLYSKYMEDRSIDEIVNYYPEVSKYYEGIKSNFLLNIQNIHDNLVNLDSLSKKFKELARVFKLDDIVTEIKKPNQLWLVFAYISMGILEKHNKLFKT